MKIVKPLSYKTHTYENGYVFNEPVLSDKGFVLYPEPRPKTQVSLKGLNTIWSDSAFSDIHLPQNVLSLNDKERSLFSFPNDLRILDMPIKFPHSHEYRIPEELSQFKDIIQKAINYEHSMNEEQSIHENYCYLTIDQKLLVPGRHTRKSGLHVDGFQGARIEKPLPVDHSYIMYDCLPTLFYNQAFKVEPEWNKICHDYFLGFEKQLDYKNEVKYAPYQLLLISAYCLHQTDIAWEPTYRTFFRMSYTVREFDRLGNAHNNLFDYSWNMVPRDTQSRLYCPVTSNALKALK